MVGISSPGLGSGLDVTGLVTGLVAAEIQPKSFRLDQKEASIQAEISAIGTITSALSKFQGSLTALSKMQSFQARKTSMSETGYFTATANNEAVSGNYQVEVIDLAQSQSLASSTFSDGATSVGSGTISIEFGSYDAGKTVFTANPDKSSQNVIISNSANTLTDIKNAINSANIGVNAAIISDDSGARLTITSEDTGAANALKITVTDDDANNTDNSGLSQLVFDPAGGVSNITETNTAQDSQVKINGLTLTNSSNTLSDNIEGVTLNLLKENPGTTIDLDVSLNTGSTKSLIIEFIKNYNDVLDTINQLTAFDKETGQGSILLGDSSIRNLRNQLSQMLYEPIDNVSSNFSTLVEIGLKSNDVGRLEFDDSILSQALNDHFDEVGRLFANGAFVDDSLIKVEATTDSVAEGIYPINLSTLNLGTDISGTIGGLSASSDDGFILNASGKLTGLSLEVLGGTTGDRGNVNVFNGIASRIDALIDNYLGASGLLTTKTENLTSQVDDISEQRTKLNERAALLEQRYLRQFTALDSQLASLQATSSFLTQQLAILSSNFTQGSNQ
jgi:flagellar hook-associated protein 2